MEQRIVFITGGSSGIGAQIVRKYSEERDIVYATFKNNRKNAKQLEELYQKNLYFFQVNLKKESSIKNLISIIRKNHKKIDILINNAGVVYPNSFSNLTLKSWKDTFSVNVYAPFLCIKHAMPLLKKSNSASIINISSMRGLPGCGSLDAIDYSASKAALINFTQTMAKLLKNITINTVAPGFVKTKNYAKLPIELKRAAENNTSIKRFIEMSEVSELCYFLTSPLARAITGSVFPIDGGYSLVKP